MDMIIKDIKYTDPIKEITLNGETVKVKQYLSTVDKSNMLQAVKEYCFNEQLIDQPKKDAILNALIVLNYTDIKFEYENEYELLEFYDYMEVNNYMVPIINSIPEIEYTALIGYYTSTVNDFDKFKTSSVAFLGSLAELGPALMEEIGEISKEIDVEALRTLVAVSKI